LLPRGIAFTHLELRVHGTRIIAFFTNFAMTGVKNDATTCQNTHGRGLLLTAFPLYDDAVMMASAWLGRSKLS
jgi:hypothetical protein